MVTLNYQSNGGKQMKQRLLIADNVNLGSGEFTRKAKGYKKIIVDPALDRELVKIVDEEVDGERILRLVPDTDSDNDNFDDEEYIIITKEFGMIGYSKDVKAEIDYLFCDDGIMFVTLKSGALVIKLEDKILMPNVNYESKVSFTSDDIMWVDANWLKSFHKSIDSDGDYAKFINEFQFHAIVSGQITGKTATSSGLSNSSFKPVVDLFEDLSLGAFDVYKAQIKVKADAKAAKNIMKQVMQGSTSSQEYDFDDDEELYEDDYDEDDEDDVSYDV